jgi:hypothetical protein
MENAAHVFVLFNVFASIWMFFAKNDVGAGGY